MDIRIGPRGVAALVAALSLVSSHAAPAAPPKTPPRPITEIRIDKSDHRLDLVSGKDVVKTYTVGLGNGGPGPKRFEGDRTTPVGTYKVSGRIKNLFHQFLIVSYPNSDDWRRYADLKARGEVPAGRGVGHSIGIHGGGSGSDWTLGCIALEDEEIDEVASLVRDGTKIVITD